MTSAKLNGEEAAPRPLTSEELKRIATKIRFNTPFALQGVSTNYNFGHIDIPGSIEIAYKKRNREDIKARTGWTIEGEGAELTMVGDPHGRTDYSEMVVTLKAGLPFALEQLTSGERDALIKMAGDEVLAERMLVDNILHIVIQVANEIVDGYTYATGNWLIRPIRTDDLLTFHISHEIDGKALTQGYILSHSPTHPLELSNLIVKAAVNPQSAALAFLNRPSKLRVYLALELRALRSCASGDTRSAVIDAWTALEAYVDNVLECALQKGGVSIADAKKLLDLRATYQPTTMRELVERANIEAKVRAGLRRAFGLKLAEDSVFWDDFKKKQEIRNEAVHGGSSPKLKMSVETLNIVRHIVDKVEAVAGEC